MAHKQLTLDCYHAALPDEPRFTLLARDPMFSHLLNLWATRRMEDINCGDRPEEDMTAVRNAQALAWRGATWRRDNYAKWREPAEVLSSTTVVSVEEALTKILEAIGSAFKGSPYAALADIEILAAAGLIAAKRQKEEDADANVDRQA